MVADTKLVKDALVTMKLVGAKKDVDSPCVRKNEEHTAQIENSEKLTPAESTSYRSSVMKLAYVAQDRVDVAEAVKCLTRHNRATTRTQVRTQKVGSILDEEQERCMLTYPRHTCPSLKKKKRSIPMISLASAQ